MEHLEEIKEYWNMRAGGYSEKNRAELSSEDSEIWSEKIVKRLPEGKCLRCLDIGCGPGFLGILLAKKGHDVTLADYSENMIKQAKENVEFAKVSAEIKKVDAQNPTFEDNTFDVIVSRNLVWNLEKPDMAYDQWLRILKKGGRLIVFDGNHYLHKFNSEYMEEKKCLNYKDPHTKHYMRGVDPSIIDNIADSLPLSSRERPLWDMEYFQKKNVAHIDVEPVWYEFLGKNGEKISVIRAFTICVEK